MIHFQFSSQITVYVKGFVCVFSNPENVPGQSLKKMDVKENLNSTEFDLEMQVAALLILPT